MIFMRRLMNHTIIGLLAVAAVGSTCAAQEVPCENDSVCESVLRPGSECIDGLCTNPFYKGGCLKHMLPDWNKIRTCGSDDPPEAARLGYCQPSSFDYTELRISGLNWESAFFVNYLLQIFLSEMLEVPTSIELGGPDFFMDYYSPTLHLDVVDDVSYEEEALFTSVQSAPGGDCRLVVNRDDSVQDYRPCMHVVMETWVNQWLSALDRMRSEKIIEIPIDLGVLGEYFLSTQRRTGYKDPTLLSYIGLSGEHNRRKLAETFKRPTTWQEYCLEVSADNCGTPDRTAQRAPQAEWESASYYVEGLYVGHFRATEANDCDLYPTNCTGFLVQWTCGGVDFSHRHVHHLEMALEPVRLSYLESKQIIYAANATQSDLIFVASYPDGVVTTFLGTDGEFTPILLPPATQACLDARADESDNCGALGDPVSACGYTPQSLKKTIARSVEKIAHPSGVDPALWSPAHDALRNFQVTNLQIDTIFEIWSARATDKWGYDFREATCQFFVDNFDMFASFIPDGYPRVLRERDVSDTAVFVPALVLSSLAAVMVLAAGFMIFRKRNSKVVFNAQVEIVFITFFGLLMIATGAFATALPANDTACISSVWFTNVGYCVGLIPLALRADSISRLAGSGKQMQRLRISFWELMRVLVPAAILVVGFLVSWTILDAPAKVPHYELSNSMTEAGDTIVTSKNYCDSDSQAWYVVSLCWQMSVLLYTLVLGLMASRSHNDLNNARNLTGRGFFHFCFVSVRIALLLSDDDSIDPDQRSGYMSIILSLDIIFAVAIYAAPIIIARSESQDSDEPLPDLFVDVSILMADIFGFTQWSSMREPNQIFKFLETVYGEFDGFAEKHNVFKVETVGDCYVAATGIPHHRSDHVVAIARFALDCIGRMRALAHELEIEYGPDTGDLGLRVAIHSGTVTGGFLRGKGARFQLFGDAMNTTRQLEITGERNRIHISETTAKLLVEAGKESWIHKREKKLDTKGQGLLQTYWLDIEDLDSNVFSAGEERELWKIEHTASGRDRKLRLVSWNVEVLHGLLRQVVARRQAIERYSRSEEANDPCVLPRASDTQSERQSVRSDAIFTGVDHSMRSQGDGSKTGGTNATIDSGMNDVVSSKDSSTKEETMPLKEVKEIIWLPKFDARVTLNQKSADDVEIAKEVLEQLFKLVSVISEMYRDSNPFHNFAHASHVVMAVTKHMSRIVAPAAIMNENKDAHKLSKREAARLHDHTYGITNDPLTQFACVFSALIHDIDHPGVPNAQLIKEDEHLAIMYEGRSVAEQNSFDLAWNLLMEDQFYELRNTLCRNKRELSRFRQLVINSVMATDLGDKELKELRNKRWDTAFNVPEEVVTDEREAMACINRKATIVIEHLIQASDVSHTMQHWRIYREWNENLFREMYEAYCCGRAEKNPADFWYKGELGFFDFYIIPLSKKLRDCGVFGVSSDENLSYATSNRAEWEARGQEVVAEMMEKIKAEKEAQVTKGV